MLEGFKVSLVKAQNFPPGKSHTGYYFSGLSSHSFSLTGVVPSQAYINESLQQKPLNATILLKKSIRIKCKPQSQ